MHSIIVNGNINIHSPTQGPKINYWIHNNKQKCTELNVRYADIFLSRCTEHSLVLQISNLYAKKNRSAELIMKINIESLENESIKLLFQNRFLKKINSNGIEERDEIKSGWK